MNTYEWPSFWHRVVQRFHNLLRFILKRDRGTEPKRAIGLAVMKQRDSPAQAKRRLILNLNQLQHKLDTHDSVSQETDNLVGRQHTLHIVSTPCQNHFTRGE